MSRQIEAVASRLLMRWVDGVIRRPRFVLGATLLLTLLSGAYAATHLGIDSDNLSLVSEHVLRRPGHVAFTRRFRSLENALLVVIDGDTPEIARRATSQLADAMRKRPDLFEEVYVPGGGDFFERHGLLYRSAEELDEFADQMARMQPLVAEIERHPDIAHLAKIVQRGLDEFDENGDEASQWSHVLDRISNATVAIYDEYPLEVSWEELMLEGSAVEARTRRTIISHPILDTHHVLLAHRPIEGLRAIARELGLNAKNGVRVRLTGNPALSYDEMIAFAWDMGGAGLFCFLLVAAILQRALRSLRLVIATLITILVGLVWTVGFASLAIGHLNLLSISFAILFIGLGVDFSIHLGAGYADLRRRGWAHRDALLETADHVGGALLSCTLTTSIGFYAFVPTEYTGMAELGLIAGTSMFIIFALTLTLFPALTSAPLAIDPARHLRADLHFRPLRSGGWLDRHPSAVRRGAAGLGVAGLILLPGLHFDVNVVKMRDPSTESAQAFRDLLAHPNSSPWYINVLEPNLESAVPLAHRIERLPSVSRAVTLASYVPQHQEEKLEILADLALLFDTPPRLESARDEVPGFEQPSSEQQSVERQVAALRALRDRLSTPAIERSRTAVGASMRRLRDHLSGFLSRVESEGRAEEALADLERLLLASFPAQMARLRAALDTDAVQLEELPPDLVARMRAADGSARIQVFPASDMNDLADFRSFVEQVQSVAPLVAGVPVNLLAFGRAIVSSFRQALVSAVLLIALLLWLMWRRLGKVLLVMAPLILGAVLTGATMVILGLHFDFTNVIVIPLLFGIGVDSGIHLIQRADEGADDAQSLLSTATARAVYYSALTTIVSFGSLGLSAHRGMRSLGIALTLGLVYTVACVLVVLPALIALRHREHPAPGDGLPVGGAK